MRALNFGPFFGDLAAWVQSGFQQLEVASREDAMIIADGFTVGDFTPTTTLHPTTATATDVANFVATFIDQLKRRGKAGA